MNETWTPEEEAEFKRLNNKRMQMRRDKTRVRKFSPKIKKEIIKVGLIRIRINGEDVGAKHNHMIALDHGSKTKGTITSDGLPVQKIGDDWVYIPK